MIVNGAGGASLCFWGLEIEFVSEMNSTVFILGGKVTFESVKINNQLNSMWVCPLVLSETANSDVSIDFRSCTISNSIYKSLHPSTSYPRSAVVYFLNQSQPITLNISLCLFCNNTFNLTSVKNYGGGFSFFYSISTSSSMFFFLNKKKEN
jgi:hypothetical protein